MNAGIKLTDEDRVGAVGFKFGLYRRIDTANDRRDEHHRDHPDHHPDYRQERPQLIGAQSIKRHLQIFVNVTTKEFHIFTFQYRRLFSLRQSFTTTYQSSLPLTGTRLSLTKHSRRLDSPRYLAALVCSQCFNRIEASRFPRGKNAGQNSDST